MTRAPASTRFRTSSAIGCATAQKSRSSGTPGGRKLQFTIVTGPVSMPFTGLLVAAWATRHSSTVIGSSMVGGAARIGGADASASVREDPAVARGVEAVHLVGEVLDHVGALELAVDEHVEAHPLLPGDRFGDEARHLARRSRRASSSPRPQLHAQLAHLVVCGSEPVVVVG